jgi:hypothetical protein
LKHELKPRYKETCLNKIQLIPEQNTNAKSPENSELINDKGESMTRAESMHETGCKLKRGISKQRPELKEHHELHRKQCARMQNKTTRAQKLRKR